MNQTRSNTTSLRPFLLWLTLCFLSLLVVLSIVGAFRGSERARVLFNSPSAIVYWLGLIVLLAVGMIVFARLRNQGGPFLIHAGCIVILIGAMLSSEKGHALQNKWLGSNKIYKGYLYLSEWPEEVQDNRIWNETFDTQAGHLPFTVRLEDYWIDYYWPEGRLLVQKYPVEQKPNPEDPNQTTLVTAFYKAPEQSWSIPDRIGEELELPAPLKKVKILQVIHKLQVRDRITDRPRDTLNPALFVELEWSDGSRAKRFVFPGNTPHPTQTDGFVFTYIFARPRRWHVKDYYSDVTVMDFNEKRQHRQIIEVNHPLHYGGYHFYQSEGGESAVPVASGEQKRTRQVGFTILEVVSDTGVSVVFLGYWLVSLGVIWQCWLRHVVVYLKQQK